MDTFIISSFLKPSSASISFSLSSIFIFGKSILLITGIICNPKSSAFLVFDIVCACIPWLASTSSIADSHAANDLDTSYEKSTCPGVSMRFNSYPFQFILHACSFMVIPFSCSSSNLSSTLSFLLFFDMFMCVASSILSARVDFP